VQRTTKAPKATAQSYGSRSNMFDKTENVYDDWSRE
jgi:hypothetical protein